jgi:hypothetical protein
MAVASRYIQQHTLNANGSTVLGGGGGAFEGLVCEFENSAFSGSITFESRLLGAGGTWQTVAYYDHSDGTHKATAITGQKLVTAHSTGVEVRVTVASYVSGSILLSVRPVERHN